MLYLIITGVISFVVGGLVGTHLAKADQEAVNALDTKLSSKVDSTVAAEIKKV